MPQVLRRPEAESDLEEIWSYIGQDSPNAADRFIDLIEAGCLSLTQNPLMGRIRPELAAGLRSFPVPNYVIFYMPLEDGIEVVRVLSGFRDVEGLFCLLSSVR